jgi:glycosyltransferase involved in cell wall biosynthesis
MTKFSVILPTYNDGVNIINAINSVLVQTEKDFEVIIVDDASTDGTYNILKEKIKDQRVRVYCHEKNLGPGAARNTGLKEAKGQYIAFLDSDDLWHPNFLETFAGEIDTYNRDLGYGFWFSCGDVYYGEKYFGVMPQSSWINNASKERILKRLYAVNYIMTQGVVVDRDIILSIGGFDASLLSAQDYELWLRMARITSLRFIDSPLFVHNIRINSITSNVTRRIKCQLVILNKHEKSMRDITATNFEYKLLRCKATSYIYSSASFDAQQRSKNIFYPLLLALKATIIYPDLRNIKRLIRTSLGMLNTCKYII